MTYRQRISVFFLIDSFIVLTAIFISRFLVNATIYVISIPIVVTALTILISHHLLSMYWKLYKKVWVYASTGELIIIFKIVSSSILLASFFQKIFLDEIYFRLLVVTWLLHMFLLGGSRFLGKMYRDTLHKNGQNIKRTLIVGAGAAG